MSNPVVPFHCGTFPFVEDPGPRTGETVEAKVQVVPVQVSDVPVPAERVVSAGTAVPLVVLP
jgi:hypothetical protein